MKPIRMNRNNLLKMAVVLVSVLTLARHSMAADAAAGTRPNIILVMTDDQGYGDLGCHGHPFLKTPNLDKLYSQSTRFTDFHASPTCAPTRAALMSGLAPFKTGVTHTVYERERMALSATTIAEVLRNAGYTTGIFGKWHLGDEDPYQPHNRGFDEVFIHGAGGIGQKYPGTCADAPENSYFDPVIRHNKAFVKTKGYCTDVFFQQALGWIRGQVTGGGSQEAGRKPFFAYIATNAPHSPYIVADKYKAMYEGKCDDKAAAFHGMITNLDDNMGLLMEKLDTWKLSDDTLLIFMTDNGSSIGTYNAGMKGKKGWVNEGGSRVPLFLRLPGTTKPGVDVDRLTRHYDLFPTLTELAGTKAPEGLKLDGRSLVPLIKNPAAQWPDRYTFFHKGRWAKKGMRVRKGHPDHVPENSKYTSFAVRNEKWRLVSKDSLYDIENDPGEEKNVIKQHPEVAQKMLGAYDKWWDEVRPLMINEDASLDQEAPFIIDFELQKKTKGIPDWTAPQL